MRSHADSAPSRSGLRFNRATPQPKRTHHILRRRFSFAHEYAHVLLDRELKAILSHARDRSSLMEVRANAFAASFLMPAEGVRGYVNALSKGLGSRTRADTFDEEAVTRVEGRKRVDTQNIELHDVVRMAHHCGVSCTAMLYRLKGLDFVTEDERSSLAEHRKVMGLGEAACLAVAEHRGWTVACDERGVLRRIACERIGWAEAARPPRSPRVGIPAECSGNASAGEACYARTILFATNHTKEQQWLNESGLGVRTADWRGYRKRRSMTSTVSKT